MKKLRKLYIGLILVFLYAPIALLILYSFNDSKSRAAWGGFTLRWYQELFADRTIMSALGTTLSLLVMVVVLAFMGALNRIDKEEEPVKEVRIL